MKKTRAKLKAEIRKLKIVNEMLNLQLDAISQVTIAGDLRVSDLMREMEDRYKKLREEWRKEGDEE